MNELEKIRKEINQIDEEMRVLFEKRMHYAKQVAEYKERHNLPVHVAKREEEIINKQSKLIKDQKVLPYYQSFLKSLFTLSKSYQEDLMKR